MRGRRAIWVWTASAAGLAAVGTAAIDQLVLTRGPTPGSTAGFTGEPPDPDGPTGDPDQDYIWNPFNRKMAAGEAAPDFALPAVGEDRRVGLADFRGRPLVLVFGSFSCDRFAGRVPDLERLYQSNRARAGFLFVNVSEANHHVPGLEFVLTGPPADRAGRVAEARRVAGLSMPAVADEGKAAERAYKAFPLRLVVVDADGAVGLDLGRAVSTPWDLGEVEAWLARPPKE